MAGYNWMAGKSNNAVSAAADGLVTRSKITRRWLQDAGIEESPAFVKWLCKMDYIAVAEWHHTSKMFNRTDYYQASGVAEDLSSLAQTGHLDILRELHMEGYPADRFEVADEMIRRFHTN